MAHNVSEWLLQLGLGKYAETFAENDVEFEVLSELSDDDLSLLGLSLGHRRKFLKAVSEITAGAQREAPTDIAEASPASPKHIEAERRQLTVVFCDLVGSTELSARLDPEDLREVMRRYQDTVAGLVARFEGHVAKFLGDGVLVFFGWPRAYEDQAERAVRSGLAAVEAVANLKTEDGQALEARVGIATGQVVIGDIVGEAATEADAVAGETPNLAARLQGVAMPGQVVIGATTRLLIGETFELAELGAQSLRGFAEPVAAWRVVGAGVAESRFEAAHRGAFTQLVGREHELGLLRRAWQQSQAGIGQVVLISGEPGIGKSRLVDALSAELGDQGYTRITLGCSPYHTNSALFPLTVHLERVLRWQREDGADARLAKLEEALQDFSLPLDEAIPLFASLLSLPLPEDRYLPISLTPQQQKQQTLDATVAWLLEEAERQPVLQVWEDLHWADPSTLELLALEIEQAPTAPILNVLTFRPEFAPPWPQRSHMTPLTLSRLERPGVEALISQQAGGKKLPGEVVEHIVEKADGVPLYVEELTKVILEADFLRAGDGSYELVGQLSEFTIPATLQDSLMARLDRLPTIREVAQLGAVLGREFSYEMVQAIASLEESTLQEGLAQLVNAELLYQRGRPPRAKYIFKHALVQDAAYQSLLKRTRRSYHRQVARLLESRFPENTEAHPEILAHHYTEAQLIEKAVGHWHLAGTRAIQRSANLEAIAHLTKGLELLEKLTEGTERTSRELVLLATLGVPLTATKGPGDSDVYKVYARARELCGKVGEAPELFSVSWGLWRCCIATAKMQEARALADELVNLAGQRQDPDMLLEAHHAQWTTLLRLGEPAAGWRHVEHGLAFYDPSKHHGHVFTYGDHDTGVCSRGMGAVCLWLLGFPDQAVEQAREGVALAERLGHPTSLAHSLMFSTYVHHFCDELDLARERIEAVTALSKQQNFAHYLATAGILRGWLLARSGSPREGLGLIRQGLDSGKAKGTGATNAYFLMLLAVVLAQVGRAVEGIEVLGRALSEVERTGARQFEPEMYRVRGELLLLKANGDVTEAQASFLHALDVARQQEARSLELRAAASLGRLWRDQGRRAEGHDLLAPVYDSFTEGLATADLKAAKALLDELS